MIPQTKFTSKELKAKLMKLVQLPEIHTICDKAVGTNGHCQSDNKTKANKQTGDNSCIIKMIQK